MVPFGPRFARSRIVLAEFSKLSGGSRHRSQTNSSQQQQQQPAIAAAAAAAVAVRLLRSLISLRIRTLLYNYNALLVFFFLLFITNGARRE